MIIVLPPPVANERRICIMMKNSDKTMDKIVALCKTRGFIFPGSEIYGGLANSWDYGPLWLLSLG